MLRGSRSTRGDSDPVSFWSCVAAALDPVVPAAGPSVRELLDASPFPIELVITAWSFVEIVVLPPLAEQTPQFVNDFLAVPAVGDVVGDVGAAKVASGMTAAATSWVVFCSASRCSVPASWPAGLPYSSPPAVSSRSSCRCCPTLSSGCLPCPWVSPSPPALAVEWTTHRNRAVGDQLRQRPTRTGRHELKSPMVAGGRRKTGSVPMALVALIIDPGHGRRGAFWSSCPVARRTSQRSLTSPHHHFR